MPTEKDREDGAGNDDDDDDDDNDDNETRNGDQNDDAGAASTWQRRPGKGRARFRFAPRGKYQIALEAGDLVEVQEFSSGWFKGVQVRTGKRGIFPAAFIELFDARSAGLSPPASSTRRDELFAEVERTLKQWEQDLAVGGAPLEVERARIAVLSSWKRMLWAADEAIPIDSVLAALLRKCIVQMLEATGQTHDGALIPRDRHGALVTSASTPLVKMYAQHLQVEESFSRRSAALDHWLADPNRAEILAAGPREGRDDFVSLLTRFEADLSSAGPVPRSSPALSSAADASRFFDIHVKILKVGLASSDPLCMYFSLYLCDKQEQVSEDFAVRPKLGQGPIADATLRFARIASAHLAAGKLAIVCKIVREGQLLAASATSAPVPPLSSSSSSSTTSDASDGGSATGSTASGQVAAPPEAPRPETRHHAHYARPVAAAVWDCSDPSNTPSEMRPAHLYLANGREDHLETKICGLLAKMAAGARSSHGNNSATANALSLSVHRAPHQEQSLRDGHTARMMEMDPYISSLALRNDVYLRLGHGVFQQDRKRAARNVETRVHIVDGEGNLLPHVLGRQRAALGSTYRSTVYYHDNAPRYEEQVLVRLPTGESLDRSAHALFVFSHASTTADRSHPFSFTFLPLFDKGGTMLRPGLAKLKCYAPLPGMGTHAALSKEVTAKYLQLQPVTRTGVVPTAEPNLRPKESFHVRVRVCSTEEPEAENLGALLRACHGPLVGQNPRATVEPLLEYAMDDLDVHDGLQHMRPFLDSLFRIMDAVEDDLLVQYAFTALASFLTRAALALGRDHFRRRFEEYVTEHFLLQPFAPRVYVVLLGNLRLWIEASPLLAHDSHARPSSALSDKSTATAAAAGADKKDGHGNPRGIRRRAMSMDIQESGAVLRCLAYLTRLIVVSRRCDEHPATNDGEARARPRSSATVFQQHLLELFYLLDELVASDVELETASAAEGLAAALKRAATTGMAEVIDFGLIDSLNDDILSVDTISEIARGFLDSLADAPADVRPGKLVFLRSLCTTSGLLARWDLRTRLLASVIRALQMHLEQSFEEQEVCALCIARLYGTVQTRDETLTASQRREDIWNVSLLLPEIFHAARGFVAVHQEVAQALPRKFASFLLSHLSAEFRAVAANLLVSAFSIVLDLDAQQLRFFMSSALEEAGTRDAANFMRDALVCCNAALHRGDVDQASGPLFPASWFSMHAATARAILAILEWFAPRLDVCFRDASARADLLRPDSSLWLLFLRTGLSLANHAVLLRSGHLADVHKQQVAACEMLTGAHARAARLLRAAWDGPLLGHRWLVAPHLALDILQLCTSSRVPEGLVALGRKIYLDMVCESIALGSDDTVHMIEHVSTAFVDAASRDADSSLIERTAELFASSLPESATPEVRADRAVIGLLDDMAQLCGLLRALDRLPCSIDFEHDRVDSIVELLNFLRRQQRDEQFLSYLDELVSMHEDLSNFEEAVNARLLRIQVRGQVREDVLWRVVRTCEQGKLWERGITVLDELRDIYERGFRTSQIPRVLRQQAEFFDALSRDQRQRFYPRYYRVSFVAQGTEPVERQAVGVWNRTFAYKGNETESLADFCARLEASFAGISVFAQGQGKPASTSDSDRWIEVQTVQPSTWFETALLETHSRVTTGHHSGGLTGLALDPALMRIEMRGAETADRQGIPFVPPARVLRQQAHAKISSVSYLMSFRKREQKSGNEFLDTWAQKHIAVLEDPGFPCLSRRLPVAREVVCEVDPLRIAIQTIQDKNCELVEQIADNAHHEKRDASQAFTMLLSGVVDAAVSGGVAKNYGPLLTGSFRADYPEILEAYGSAQVLDMWTALLRELVSKQVDLLEEAVQVHGRVCAEAVIPLHEYLCGKMDDLKAEFRDLCAGNTPNQ